MRKRTPGFGGSPTRRRVVARLVGTVLVLAGIFSALTGAVSIAAIPKDSAQVRAYNGSGYCGTGDTPGRDDCFYLVPATVEATTIKSGRSSTYTVAVRGDAADLRGTVVLNMRGGDRLLLRELRSGDRVSVVMWRHRRAAVLRGRVIQATTDTPHVDPDIDAGIATGFGAFAVWAVWAGAVRIVRPESRAAYLGLVVGGKMLLWSLGATILAGVAGAVWGGPWTVLVVWTVLAGLVVWGVLARQRQIAARHGGGRPWTPRGPRGPRGRGGVGPRPTVGGWPGH